ncbi:MAG: beta-N-acetylhexosaminidase [Opitutaceae bacterium]|jgi:hypothetical protein|nr:beta-N-acetylhexosaminidase [Opitutaceae bacterium]
MNLNITSDHLPLPEGLTGFARARGITLGENGTPVIVRRGPCLLVSGGSPCVLEYNRKAEFFRALALLTARLAAGDTSFEIREQARFETCGLMVDCSRNAVLTVAAAKALLLKMAAMGLNRLMLYTEDTYELTEYPYFGYMRGRYTKTELREIDAFAAALGIEVVPCLQTLGHLRSALRWPCANDIKDTDDILLVGEEKTYALIDSMLRTASECFTSKRIHIGMDEAHNVGLGRYLARHGYQNRFDILSRHLDRVAGIAKARHLEPMMWSDMFFRLGSGTGDYYDTNARMPADISRKIPEGIGMVYWDYYHDDPRTYQKMMELHRQFGREIIFAGGIWTWQGMGIHYPTTFSNTAPALAVAGRQGVKHVFATLWGDDGAEVNINSALLGMQLYAEYNYSDNVSEHRLAGRFRECLGLDAAAFLALTIDDYPESWNAGNSRTTSKQVLWQDLLLGLFDKNFEGLDLRKFYQSRLDALGKIKTPESLAALFDYHEQLLKTLAAKCDMGLRLAKACHAGDTSILKNLIHELRALRDDMALLHKKFRTLWLGTHKPFGLERMDLRFGGALTRIDVAAQRLEDLVEGRISRIEELEEPRLMFGQDGSPGEGGRLVYCQSHSSIAVPASASVS